MSGWEEIKPKPKPEEEAKEIKSQGSDKPEVRNDQTRAITRVAAAGMPSNKPTEATSKQVLPKKKGGKKKKKTKKQKQKQNSKNTKRLRGRGGRQQRKSSWLVWFVVCVLRRCLYGQGGECACPCVACKQLDNGQKQRSIENETASESRFLPLVLLLMMMMLMMMLRMGGLACVLQKRGVVHVPSFGCEVGREAKCLFVCSCVRACV